MSRAFRASRGAPSRLRRAVAGLALLGAVAGLVTSVPPGRPSPASASPAPVLHWSPCSNNRAVQCADLTVPLDPAKPDGATIKVAVSRMPATDPHHRIGSLLVNPGGPGASGRTFTFQIATALALSPLRERFDIVGWDPRGVGATTPVRCLSSWKDYDRLYADDPTPDTPDELATLKNDTKQFAVECGEREGSRLDYVSTDDVVFDMDQIRLALGEDRISYLGFSYGTYLGAKYADRYPQHVRAFVLDGALDPTADADERVRQQAAGFEMALNDFLADCAQSTCAFVHKGETAGQAYDRLMASFERTPLPVGKGAGMRLLGPGESSTAVLASLYNRASGWPTLRGALTRADKGDGRGLMALFDQYADRQPDGSYLNTADANAATNCTDVPASRDPAHYDQLAAELAKADPRFGQFAAYSTLVCAYWPAPVTGTLAPVHATGAPPILVVGTTHDPATPYTWAQSMAKQLDSGVLLTYVGEGHTAFFSGSQCIHDAVQRYLLTTTPPKAGTRCT